jgi:hypothetical protein
VFDVLSLCTVFDVLSLCTVFDVLSSCTEPDVDVQAARFLRGEGDETSYSSTTSMKPPQVSP